MKNKSTVIATIAVATTLITGSAIANQGKTDYESLGCVGCHGMNGIAASPAYPNLAGQNAQYTIDQLKKYQSGERVDPTMNAMAAMATGKETAIAQYLESLK